MPIPDSALELFVLGDSISMHYGPCLKDYIAPAFNYSRKGEGKAVENLDVASSANGGDSSACIAYLEGLLTQPALRLDILMWNCGLHDIKTTPNGWQVPFENYCTNLEKGIDLIKQHGIRPVWVNTTAAFEDIHNSRTDLFQRFHADVIKCNQAAAEIMRQKHVTVIDLYSFTLKFGKEAVCDHVHFHENVRQLQAAFIAGHLLQLATSG